MPKTILIYPQTGEQSYYMRRRPKDSMLDVTLPIIDQFNLLRVVDNERYPAFFEVDGINYVIHISKASTNFFQ